MDTDRFDDLIRSLPLGSSRRAVLTAFGSGLLAMLPLAAGNEEAGARKKRKKKKKKKNDRIAASPPPPPPPPPCNGACLMSEACVEGACCRKPREVCSLGGTPCCLGLTCSQVVPGAPTLTCES